MAPGSSCFPAHPFRLTVLRKHSDYYCCILLDAAVAYRCISLPFPSLTPNVLNQQNRNHPVFIVCNNGQIYYKKQIITGWKKVLLYTWDFYSCFIPLVLPPSFLMKTGMDAGFSFSRNFFFPSPVDRKFLVCWLGWYLASNPQNVFLAQWMQSEKRKFK